MISVDTLITLVVVVGVMLLSLWLWKVLVSLGSIAVSLIAIYYGIVNNWQPIPYVVCAICAAVALFAMIRQAGDGEII